MTVTIPLFGGHRGVETLTTVARAWLAQDLPCEVVVAMAGEIDLGPTASTLGSGFRLVRGAQSWRSPGRLRNLAVRSARSRLIYLSDADVLPMRPDYLRQALGMASGSEPAIVIQPWTFRLVCAQIPVDIRTWHPPARRLACYVTTDENGVLTPVPGERFGGQGADLKVSAPLSVTNFLGLPANSRVHRPCHWGGVLLEKQLFEEVGGYCTEYVGWGCQDDDLLVKLSSRRAVVRAWQVSRTVACLHFEHPRPYGGAVWAANRTRLERRKIMGTEAMISADAEQQRSTMDDSP